MAGVVGHRDDPVRPVSGPGDRLGSAQPDTAAPGVRAPGLDETAASQMKDLEGKTMRASDRGPLPQELQRRFLKQVLRVIGLDSEPGAGIGDQPGPPLAVEQYGLRDLPRAWCGDFRFHRVLWFSFPILLCQAWLVT